MTVVDHDTVAAWQAGKRKMADHTGAFIWTDGWCWLVDRRVEGQPVVREGDGCWAMGLMDVR